MYGTWWFLHKWFINQVSQGTLGSGARGCLPNPIRRWGREILSPELWRFCFMWQLSWVTPFPHQPLAIGRIAAVFLCRSCCPGGRGSTWEASVIPLHLFCSFPVKVKPFRNYMKLIFCPWDCSKLSLRSPSPQMTAVLKDTYVLLS